MMNRAASASWEKSRHPGRHTKTRGKKKRIVIPEDDEMQSEQKTARTPCCRHQQDQRLRGPAVAEWRVGSHKDPTPDQLDSDLKSPPVTDTVS